MKEMIILRGCPGSGKSSLAKILAQLPNSIICSADDYFTMSNGEYNFDPSKLKHAHFHSQQKARIACDNDFELVIIDNTNTTQKEFQPYLDIAKQFGYNVRQIIIENNHGSKSVHDVPEETIQKMKQRFEVNI